MKLAVSEPVTGCFLLRLFSQLAKDNQPQADIYNLQAFLGEIDFLIKIEDRLRIKGNRLIARPKEKAFFFLHIGRRRIRKRKWAWCSVYYSTLNKQCKKNAATLKKPQ